MLIERLELKDTGEEIVAHANNPFPHTAYYVEPERFPGGYIPWHWHADLEVMYVAQGKMTLQTNISEYTLSAGDAIFINTNVLHFQKPYKGMKVITLNQVFDTSLISGRYKSIFEQKYVEPILGCQEIDVMIFKQSDVRHRKIIELIKLSQDAADEKAYGYEIMVRNYLSSMWLLLCQEAQDKINAKKITGSTGEDRLKVMMRYIQSHYMDKILLRDIAYAANISEREAMRTFRNNLNVTPFNYLMEYRLRMAMVRLSETSDSISRIAYDCGFCSSSYFGKEFRKYAGCTANEYRRK